MEATFFTEGTANQGKIPAKSSDRHCSEICVSCFLSLHTGLVVPCIGQTDPHRETYISALGPARGRV